MVVGTAGYMSPEQVRGEAVDARSDIFSFGTILYEMLTGRPAFTRETAAETMAAILKEDPPEPLPRNVPPALERIVSRCLEKTREARFQSARDLAFALECLPGTTATAAAASSISRLHWVRRPALPVGRGRRARVRACAGARALGAVANSAGARAAAPQGRPGRGRLAGKHAREPVRGRHNPLTRRHRRRVRGAEGETGSPQLYVRRLDQLQATPLSGTDDALCSVFFAGRTVDRVFRRATS